MEKIEKNKLTAIILAAGQGTRMKSPLPKVLHPVAGQAMITCVIDTVKSLEPSEIRVVIGNGKDLLERVLKPLDIKTYEQTERKGTAHAVMSADLNSLSGDILILNGDHPLITKKDLEKALAEYRDIKPDLAILTCDLDDPKDFGRIVRQNDKVQAVVESKDASTETLKIKEINTGAYIVSSETLKTFLPQIHPHNVQNEYYLTDLVGLCVENAKKVLGIKVSERFAFGVNDQEHLAKATQIVVQDKIKSLMRDGVIFINPESSYIENSVQIDSGAVIYPNVFIKGKTSIGAFTVIEPNCFIMNSEIHDSVQIKMGSHLEGVIVKSKALVGPYARLRPETLIGEDARVGNFVEMKKVQFGDKSKASHLTYLGDATIGREVNIGCGTITCNYAADKKKYKTEIEDGVFVGSDTQFVAPVKIGSGAIIGSGSTITKDVPANALGVARGKQNNIENYALRKKDK